jgi:Ca-activated chloride channel family protein
MNSNSKIRRGATMVTVVILLPVLFALAAIAVNLAYIQVVSTKLQIVTDAATRAAGWEYVKSGDEALALDAARQLAELNPVETMVMSIDSTDLEFGQSERSYSNEAFTFTASSNGNAVRLTTNSFAAGGGDAVRPFFPIFGAGFEIRPVLKASLAQATLDVALVVDKSGSMAFAANEQSGGTPASAPEGWAFGNPVPPGSRWHDLVAAVDVFSLELDSTVKIEKLALVGYDSVAVEHHHLCDDYTHVRDELDKITNAFHGGSTATGDGILQGLTTVRDTGAGRVWASKALIVMCDGDYNAGVHPHDAAADAAAAGIPVFTITFSDFADQTLMQDVANMTGGAHYHADNGTQLQQAFREIAKRLPAMLTE